MTEDCHAIESGRGKAISEAKVHSIYSRTVKFMFFKKATKIDEIFTIGLTLCSKRHIDVEDFLNSCVLLRKYEL